MDIFMAKFKDLIYSDIATFLNLDEFAETCIIDGKNIDVIVDNDRLIERSKKEYEGISVGEILYYAKVADFNKKPKQGMPQNFNGRLMQVFDIREDEGLYEIILNQNIGG